MPVHDWTRVKAGIFHDFHHEWISENKRAINRVLKGTEYYALAEQIAGSLGPDVLTLQVPDLGPSNAKVRKRSASRRNGAVALAKSPPKLRFRIIGSPVWYTRKKKQVTIRHVSEHRLVALLEIVSPGNKAGRSAINQLILKAQELLTAGIHLTVVDLFPPTPRDPEGIHAIIFGEDDDNVFKFDPAKPLICASYVGGLSADAFVEPVAVGDKLPTIPLFLTPDEYVPVPLEATYKAAFDAVPEFWQNVLTSAAKNAAERQPK